MAHLGFVFHGKDLCDIQIRIIKITHLPRRTVWCRGRTKLQRSRSRINSSASFLAEKTRLLSCLTTSILGRALFLGTFSPLLPFINSSLGDFRSPLPVNSILQVLDRYWKSNIQHAQSNYSYSHYDHVGEEKLHSVCTGRTRAAT